VTYPKGTGLHYKILLVASAYYGEKVYGEAQEKRKKKTQSGVAPYAFVKVQKRGTRAAILGTGKGDY